jgi:hypothetical protein
MDQGTRQDIAAAAAAHRELGSTYDDAFAESLIDRIGAEIDKRVDAKLETRRTSRRVDAAELGRRRTLLKGATIGAAATGAPAVWVATASQDPRKGVVALVILIWVAIAVSYTIARWAHSLRERDD